MGRLYSREGSVRPGIQQHLWALLLGLLCTLLASPLAQAVDPDKHVRVVFDTSGSMGKYGDNLDKDRKAALSVLLLADLVGVEAAKKDSFKVYPFGLAMKKDQDWYWQDDSLGCKDMPIFDSSTPVVKTGGGIYGGTVVKKGPLIWDPHGKGRAGFHEDFAAVVDRYLSPWTYYLPGLRAAVDDLAALPKSRNKVKKVVVLVTDGLPSRRAGVDGHTTGEMDCIRDSKIREQMRDQDIDFYVLAFGEDANKNPEFYEELTSLPDGWRGSFWKDEDGSQLTHMMAKLFGASFGYQVTDPHKSGSSYVADLKKGGGKGRSYVVGLDNSSDPPKVGLEPPGGNTRSKGKPGEEASLRSWSYRIEFEDDAHEGRYIIDTLADQRLVLRPVELSLKWLDKPNRLIGGKGYTLSVEVRSRGGTEPVTDDIVVQWRTFNGALEKDSSKVDSDDSQSPYYGQLDLGPTQIHTFNRIENPDADGRFNFEVYFPDLRGNANPGESWCSADDWKDCPPEPYPGNIEIRVQRKVPGGDDVLELDPTPEQVSIMPFVGFEVLTYGDDNEDFARIEGKKDLEYMGEKECTEIMVQSLGAPDVDSEDQEPLEGLTYVPGGKEELYFTFMVGSPVSKSGNAEKILGLSEMGRRRTYLTLDDDDVQLASGIEERDEAEDQAGLEWYYGKIPWELDELDEAKELCIHPGAIKKETEANLPIIVGLAGFGAPYSDTDALVRDFTLTVQTDKRHWLDDWVTLLTLLLLMLLSLLGFWYLRYRPDVPGDLRLAMGPRERLQPITLGDPVFWRRMLALRPRYPVHTAQGDRDLGTLIPVDGDLYLFKASMELRLSSMEGSTIEQAEGGHLLSAGRLYHLEGGGINQWMRIEYG